MGALAKPGEEVLVSPEVDATPAVAPVSLRLFAPPAPLGHFYLALTVPSAFEQWSPLYRAQVTTSVTIPMATPVFVPLDQFIDYGGRIPVPAGARPAFAPDSADLIGFYVDEITYAAEPGISAPQWWGPQPNTRYFQFDNPLPGSNGYPSDPPGTIVTGRVQVPTEDGWVTLSRRFQVPQLLSQRLMPVDGDPDPPYCTTKPGYGVVALRGFPGAPWKPGAPKVTRFDDTAGWNAGANSRKTLDGNVITTFYVDVAGACAVGFTARDERADDLSLLTHAVYVDYDPAGGLRWRPMERGKVVGSGGQASADTKFSLVRVRGEVTLEVDDVTAFTFSAPSYGPVRVGSALYRAGDMVF